LQQVEHQINSNLKINSVDAVIEAAKQGLRISALVETIAHEEIRTGELTLYLKITNCRQEVSMQIILIESAFLRKPKFCGFFRKTLQHRKLGIA